MKRPSPLRSVNRKPQDSTSGMMGDQELFNSVERLCEVKAEEFRMCGYENVTSEQIWACVSESYRRGLPRVNRLVNDIMSLKANNFMNWLMVSVYKQP
ncbi:post-transcriptional regulator [Risungbinella massiliensis]|uniref:post-transcriptional regulator n=1 Tax=Risungbinella massiliensis TaxID=1329796 RepID=UPI001E4AA004|nr:post-transcriptional regulator [Risungbinella massiliensis]